MQHEALACQNLWVAVLLTAARDLLGSRPDSLEAHRVRVWIGTADFSYVCGLAGLDAHSVAARMHALEARMRGSGAKARRGQPILKAVVEARNV